MKINRDIAIKQLDLLVKEYSGIADGQSKAAYEVNGTWVAQAHVLRSIRDWLKGQEEREEIWTMLEQLRYKQRRRSKMFLLTWMGSWLTSVLASISKSMKRT